MSLARGSINLEVARKAMYERQNSPIFAPFMINIVCNLLNDSILTQYQNPLNVHEHIGRWGGGLELLKKCYPSWDQRVNECCHSTGIGHSIWKQFVDYHDIPKRDTFDPIHTLQHLLQQWINIGHQNNNYGPYPTPFEQEKYQNVAIVPMGHIAEAIASKQFEPSFKANNLDLESFIMQQQKEKEEKSMDEDGKDEYKGNVMDDPFNYNGNKPYNYNIDERESQNFGQNNNFRGFERNTNNMNQSGGTIYYQSAYYTRYQIEDIARFFASNKRNESKSPILLFGDNNVDKLRNHNEKRLYFGGQAEYLGDYDRSFAFGIITTWKLKHNEEFMNEQSSYFQGQQQYEVKRPNFIEFKHLMNKQFKELLKYICSGRDIIVPAPNDNDLRSNPSKYYEMNIDGNKQLKFRHNLGTGTGNLEEEYLKYIQFKLDELGKYASNIKGINYNKMYWKQQEKRSNNNNSSPFGIDKRRNKNNQNAVTLSPRESQKRKSLHLPFDNRSSSGIKDKNRAQRRLIFDEKEDIPPIPPKQHTNEYKQNDPYHSLIYESPQNRPQQRRNKGNIQQQQEPEYNDNAPDLMQQQQQEEIINTPPRNRRLPHYKSPSGYVESKEEWRAYSSPYKQQQPFIPSQQQQQQERNGYNEKHKYIEQDIGVLLWCLHILFYYPRKIYISLVIQNRPQDALKYLCVMFAIFAIITFILSWEVTTTCIMWIIFAIFCALGGADKFYPLQSKNENGYKNRFNQKRNRGFLYNQY